MQNEPIRRSILFAALAGSLAPAASAQVTFTIENHGPTVGVPDAYSGVPITEGDILTPSTGPPGPNAPALAAPAPPGVVISGGFGPPGPGLGLFAHGGCIGHAGGTPCPTEVDAMSYGRDKPIPANNLIPLGTVLFSVDEFAKGAPGALAPPNVSSEGAPTINKEASADVFSDMGLLVPAPMPPFASPPANTAVIDGNGAPNAAGVAYPGLGLVEPNPFGPPPDAGDNLDGFDIGVPGAPSAYPVYFSMDSGFVDPLTGFPWNGTAAVHGVSGAAVVVTAAPGGPPVPYALPAALGLDLGGFDTDDLDALALWENGILGYQPSAFPGDWMTPGTTSDMLLFSVRRGSAVIGLPDSIFGIPIEEGDILTTPLPTALGGVSPFPGIYIAAENLGLATMRSGFPGPTGDELDALDFVGFPVGDCNGNGITDAIDIAMGVSSDCNSNGLPDECEPDCNGNGVPDGCDIASGISTDVNGNGVPDECELIAMPYCFCDSTKPAPCLNFDATAGCRNSTGAGALITATGTSSVLNDDLFLSMGPLPTFQFGLFYMGTGTTLAPFGDGLRCVGGTTCRFPVINSGAGGGITFGPVVGYTTSSLPPACGITAFSTWRFQGWFRDPAGPCGNGFNLTNALSVTFTP